MPYKWPLSNALYSILLLGIRNVHPPDLDP